MCGSRFHNLGLLSLKLDLTMLDDPLQSLNAINLLGLVDVLRSFRQHQQIIVSTHEPKLLGLLQGKRGRCERVNVSWTTDGAVYRSLSAGYDTDTRYWCGAVLSRAGVLPGVSKRGISQCQARRRSRPRIKT